MNETLLNLFQIGVSVLNTDAIVAFVVASVAGYVATRIFGSGNKLKKFEPLLITACKLAEKAIPDDAESKGARRADYAIKIFLKEYERITGVSPNAKIVEAANLALPEIHDMLEANGTL